MFTRFLDKSPSNGGYVFISQRFGDNIIGDGTKENPVKTAQQADILGSIFIFDIGVYDISNTTGFYYGESRKNTILTSPSVTNAVFFDNLTIRDCFSGIGAFFSNVTFNNCNIYNSLIRVTGTDGRGFLRINNSIVHLCNILSPYFSELYNNMFSACTGNLNNNNLNSGIKFNNYFFDNNDFIWNAGGGDGKTDFNVFEDLSMLITDNGVSKTISQFFIDHPNQNQNSFQENNPYISYNKNMSQTEYQIQTPFLMDGTQCSQIGFGLPYKFFIGPYWIGKLITLNSLSGSLILTNVINNLGKFELIDDTINGSIEQPTAIQVSTNPIDVINFDFQQILDYNGDGSIFRYLNSENPYEISDTLLNQSDRSIVEFAFGQTELDCNNAVLRKFDLSKGFLIDDQGRTSGESDFDLSKSIKIDSFSWTKFKLQIKVNN